MRCQFCGKRLPILRKLTDGEFCSPAHRRAFTEQQEQQALSRLLEASLNAVPKRKKNLAHPDAESLVVPGGPTVPGRPHAAAKPPDPEPIAAADTPPPRKAERSERADAPPGCDRFFSTPIALRAMARPRPVIEPAGADLDILLPERILRRAWRPASLRLEPVLAGASSVRSGAPAFAPSRPGRPEPLASAERLTAAPARRTAGLRTAGSRWALARPTRLGILPVGGRQRIAQAAPARTGWSPEAPRAPRVHLTPEMDWAPAHATGAWAISRLLKPRAQEFIPRAILVAPLRPVLDAAGPSLTGAAPRTNLSWPSPASGTAIAPGTPVLPPAGISSWPLAPLDVAVTPRTATSRTLVASARLAPWPHDAVSAPLAVEPVDHGVLATISPAPLAGAAFSPSTPDAVRHPIQGLRGASLLGAPGPEPLVNPAAWTPIATQPILRPPKRTLEGLEGAAASRLARGHLAESRGLAAYQPHITAVNGSGLARWSPGLLDGRRAPALPPLGLATVHELQGPPPPAGLLRLDAAGPASAVNVPAAAHPLAMAWAPFEARPRCPLPLRGARPKQAQRLLRLPFLLTPPNDVQYAVICDQPMVYARPVPPRTVLRPDPARMGKQSLAQDALRQIPANLKVPVVERFWKRAPADLRWVALVIPVVLLIGWYSLAPKKRLSDEPLPEAPAAVAATAPPANEGLLDSYLKNFKANISRRAAIELSDDFRSGLAAWEGDQNWSDDWAYDQAGFVRPGALALLRPSVRLEDYSFEFLGMIDRRALSWVYRAKDTRNYHLGRLVIVQGGPLPQVAFVRSVVKNGREISRKQVTLHEQVRTETLYRVRVDVSGSDFTTSVLGKVVDTYTDETHPVGGIGFLAQRGEQSRIRWVELSHQYDTLGRFCAWLAPNELTKPLEKDDSGRETREQVKDRKKNERQTP